MSQSPFTSINLLHPPPVPTAGLPSATQFQFALFGQEILTNPPNDPTISPHAARPRTNSTAFQPPAHKHAHHLHSIPPREKSTRTLIIDYMLWVHGRTRFAQARAELGMTDRTGGPTSKNYAHAQRPENFEEDEEVPSDGEEIAVLRARLGPFGDLCGSEEDVRTRKRDLNLARSLRLRSEGMEKVVTSMLDQPPAVHPNHDDNLTSATTSPRLKPHSDSSHPHTLPNGVRLRLALSAVINDLFARQAPVSRQHQAPGSVSVTSDSIPSESPELSSASISLDATQRVVVPPALIPLSHISGISSTVNPPPDYLQSYVPYISFLPTPSAHARALYADGADPHLSSPQLCPRHLRVGCDTCADAKSNLHGRTSFSLNATIEARRRGTCISGWLDSPGVGSGLARPATSESVLRRRPAAADATGGGGSNNGAGCTLAGLLPRFVRLSALVSAELASEARDAELGEQREWAEPDEDRVTRGLAASGAGPAPRMSARCRVGAPPVLRPTREWYMLLAGLATRAVLEGYATCRWKGTAPLECLLLLGQGVNDVRGEKKGEGRGGEMRECEIEDDFAWFDPDETPSLQEATRILFPSLGTRKSMAAPSKEGPEAEFEAEMRERLRRFYDVPASTADLSMHMEALARQYPAEPVERAALRFCEAIAQWRGKPKLETNKRNPPRGLQTPLDTGMPIDALVRSTPSSPEVVHPLSGGASGIVAPLAPRTRTRRLSMQTYFASMHTGNGAPASVVRGEYAAAQPADRPRAVVTGDDL